MNPVYADCLWLSSGKLATLTGARDHETLDAVHKVFLSFLNLNGTNWAKEESKFETWVEAWEAFRSELEEFTKNQVRQMPLFPPSAGNFPFELNKDGKKILFDFYYYYTVNNSPAFQTKLDKRAA